MTNLNIALKAELETRIGAAELLQAPGDVVLVTRGKPRWFLMRCPCGCGEDIPVNIDPRAGKAWRLYRGNDSQLTLFPSVWRDTGCGSHFVVWRDRILMFGPKRSWGVSPREEIDIATLSKRVFDTWPQGQLVSYVQVADTLQEIPWDVLEICKDLVKAGVLVEGDDDRRGHFQIAPLETMTKPTV
jgi:hypothetical protein